MKRYSAKLLFQYCEKLNNKAVTKKRLCEERIITFHAKSAKSALAFVKQYGKNAHYSFKTLRDTVSYFEFVGVRELLCLETKTDVEEVWYEYRDMIQPMERRKSLIPKEENLEAIRMKE